MSNFFNTMEIADADDPPNCCREFLRFPMSPTYASLDKNAPEFEEMTIDTIMNGNETFPGLLPLTAGYLASIEGLKQSTHVKLKRYLQIIQEKASGKRRTAAKWTRDFVQAHPNYKKDSVVSDEITYDLCKSALNLKADDLVAL